LDEKEENIKKKLVEAIADPSKFKDTPTSKLDEATLTSLFSFTVDKELKDKWVASVDGKTLDESKLNNIILNDYGPSKNKHDKLLSHLVDTGDGFEGKKDEKNYKGGTPDEKKKT